MSSFNIPDQNTGSFLNLLVESREPEVSGHACQEICGVDSLFQVFVHVGASPQNQSYIITFLPTDTRWCVVNRAEEAKCQKMKSVIQKMKRSNVTGHTPLPSDFMCVRRNDV